MSCVHACLDCGSVGLILDCLVFKSHIIIQWLESKTSFLNTQVVNRSSANWLHCGPEFGLSLGAPSLTVLSLMSYANTSVVVL